ncbi:MAG: cation diffusion facilitator family transporter [Acidobacteriota bacterium]|nr:cation diffusion facilitator family transporter [Acidobacteriota bacterium]
MSHHHHHDALAPAHGGKLPSRWALGAALVCTLTIAVVEFVGGILANSLALQGDAGHMLSDAAALGVSFLAAWLATRPMTARRTFGFHRAEVLAALLNSVFLLGIAGWVGIRAIGRLGHPVEVAAVPVLIIAIIGLIVNLLALKILGHHQHSNLNIRGAFLHVLGDTLGSAGVIVAAIVIHFTGWNTIDSLVSIGIACLLVLSGARLLRDSISVLMLATPANVDGEAVRSGLLSLPGVLGIHDLHIWTVNSGFVSLTCHADIEANTPTDVILRSATQLLRERFGIRHVTIQPEVTRVHGDADSCQILAT